MHEIPTIGGTGLALNVDAISNEMNKIAYGSPAESRKSIGQNDTQAAGVQRKDGKKPAKAVTAPIKDITEPVSTVTCIDLSDVHVRPITLR